MFGRYSPADLSLPSRRRFLTDAGLGLGSVALATLLNEQTQAAPAVDPLALREPHFPARTKRIIWLFMTGAPSQVDTWDYKPELQKRDGTPLAGADPKTGFFTTSGKCLASPFKWAQHGQSGSWVSDLFPHLSKHVDDMAFIHSMHLKANNHAPASMELMCGLDRPGLPSLGAWSLYGLGAENRNLPAYVVLHDSKPRGDDQIWSAGFLPKTYQAMVLDARRKEAIDNLVRPAGRTEQQQRSALDLLKNLNTKHAADRPTQADLAARIESYELAFRMQSSAPELIDLKGEKKETLDMYGVGREDKAVQGPHRGGGKGQYDAFARNCLLARRLVERGVRFVNLFHASWDHHSNLDKELTFNTGMADQPVAAMIKDLKQRGLLDSTLVVWMSEFGRTPLGENRGGSKNVTGRDHHPFGFSLWMAGGGIKGGQVIGKTDEIGWNAIEDPIHVNDLHATLLHLFGMDHLKLTYRFQGRDFRLTDVAGKLVNKMLA